MSRLHQLSTKPPPGISAIAVSHHAQRHKVSRAPMVNPYDRFTQPEFDAWIGDMTSTLRRALGYEQEEPLLLEGTHVNGAAKEGSPKYHQLDFSDLDEVADDSFAQIKSRRNKGKARDPREGPGLGRDRMQPIQAVSEEEEEEEVEDLAFSFREDDDPDVYGQHENVESGYVRERSFTSDYVLSSPLGGISPPTHSRRKDVAEESSGGSEDDNDEYEDVVEGFVERITANPEVITISDDDESDDDDDEGENYRKSNYHNRPGPSSFRYTREDSAEEDDEQPLDDDTSFSPHRNSSYPNLELSDPWEGPRKYAEDFYSGGELRVPAGVQLHPDHIGLFDEDIETVEEDEDEIHDQDIETLSNLQPTSENCRDHYSKGKDIASLDLQFDPHFPAPAEDVDGGIDSFLTPEALTPSESRIHLDETDEAEIGSTHESVQPLLHSVSTPIFTSRRNEPIPQDAEIIAVDDSDDYEDEEDGLQVIPPPDAILEAATEPALVHLEESDVVVEEFQTGSVDNVGDDEVLSIHTAYTEDLRPEPYLQPFEIVEPEAVDSRQAEESLAMAFNVRPILSEKSEFELEEHQSHDIEIIEPGVALLNAVEDALLLDAGLKTTTVEVDEQAPRYYEDFDDIYGTPVPEALPQETTDGGRNQSEEPFTWDHEALDDMTSQDSDSSAVKPTWKVGIDDAELEVQSSQWFGNNTVAEGEHFLETSRSHAISVSRDSTPPNGVPNAVPFTSHPKAEGPEPKSPEFTPKSPVLHSPSQAFTVPGQPQIPMPVLADANVPDPTESPTRLEQGPILSIPSTPEIVVTPLQTPQIGKELVPEYPPLPPAPLLHAFNQSTDGLFTPADFSTATTPAEVPSEWQDEDVSGSQTAAIVDLDAYSELTEKPATPSPEGVGDILTETDIVPTSASQELAVSMHLRKSVLISDPYPYCLSTPIVPVSDDGSSLSEDENSICSNPTGAVELPSLPLMTELEADSAPFTEATDGTQAMLECPQNLLGVTRVEEFGILPTLQKDTPMMTELQYSTMVLDDSSTVPAEPSVEVSSFESSTTTQPPLDVAVAVDADVPLLGQGMEVNSQTPKEMEASDSAIVKDLQVERGSIPQATEIMISRPSKRKKETSSDSDPLDDFSVEGKVKLHTRRSKRRVKEAKTVIVEQPEHDTIQRDSALSRASENSGQKQSPDADVSFPIDQTSELLKVETTRPHLQYQAPPLFHAHGRAKHQKPYIQLIANTTHTRDYEDQPANQSATQHTPVSKKLPLQPGSLRNPSSLSATLSTMVEAVQSDALVIAEPSQHNSTTKPAPVVDIPIQEHEPTPQPSPVATANESLQSAHSMPTTDVVNPQPLQSSPARLLPPSNSISSIRSTRSQCRYHKITLPKEENGPRVCFLVPGCSLTNQELMKEEEIEDHGEATYADSLRVIQEIEELNFDQYLIGILRQLVGLDILREGEVFYLPQPGDEVSRKSWPRKSISERMSTAKGTYAGSPGYSYSGSARSPSTRPPLSNADSMSASIPTTDDLSDMDNNRGSSVMTGDRTSPSKGKLKINTRKSKTKETAFHLHEHDEESPDEKRVSKKRRQSTKRGVKRTRTHDGVTENDGARKSKRLRQHLTDSSLGQP